MRVVLSLSKSDPVPAGINLPMITFSFNPFSLSILPLIAASVRTFVVSWNDAADKNESVSTEAFEIPNNVGPNLAGRLPDNNTPVLISVIRCKLSVCPVVSPVSPPSIITTFFIIWRIITSICLSEISIP
ncbi:hypothetical protein SDC9_188061 [bioreactor metagenome]|uniref:Uncharacterized protein n=1 Tax=bioreactor metagenome TaxID=1076179 RepID=A0A645HZ08_9ZZZZ